MCGKYILNTVDFVLEFSVCIKNAVQTKLKFF